MSEDRFSRDDWHEVFSELPTYPHTLPDVLVRDLAQLAIYLREAPRMLTDGLQKDDWLLSNMPLSLLSGQLKQLAEHVGEIQRGTSG